MGDIDGTGSCHYRFLHSAIGRSRLCSCSSCSLYVLWEAQINRLGGSLQIHSIHKPLYGWVFPQILAGQRRALDLGGDSCVLYKCTEGQEEVLEEAGAGSGPS